MSEISDESQPSSEVASESSSEAAAGKGDDQKPRPNVVRRLYDWVLGWADTPYGTAALVFLAVAESSFFPVPPDVLLIALALSAPTRAFRFAAWCTFGSVLGGIIGYAIGWGLWASVGPYMLGTIFPAEKFEHVMEIYREYGLMFVFVAAFTPIPYKIFTIAAGVAHLNLPMFVGVSIVGRGARFFLVALFIRLFGDRARALIDRYFNVLTIAATLFLVGGFLLLKVL